MSKEHPKRILVIRFGAIGDIILTFPAIMALKKAWPDAHITYLTKEKFSPLVTPQSFIDDVLCLEPNESIQSLRAKVAAAGIDGIIDLHGQLRSKALRSFNTIPTLAQKIPRSLWESSSVRLGWALHQPKSKIVEDHHRVMDSVVGHRLDREKIHFQVSPQQKAAAQARLHQAGFNFKQKTLGISPGANWFTKRWSSERFSEVAKRAKTFYPELKFVAFSMHPLKSLALLFNTHRFTWPTTVGRCTSPGGSVFQLSLFLVRLLPSNFNLATTHTYSANKTVHRVIFTVVKVAPKSILIASQASKWMMYGILSKSYLTGSSSILNQGKKKARGETPRAFSIC
jgi:hypothetical protein